MGIHTFVRKQILPASLSELWDFVATPRNLEKITPSYLGFEILTPELPAEMYPGLMISYYVRPLLGIRMKWVTEITHVKPGVYFVDEQRLGPYALWHHQHHLTETRTGVEMLDIVNYVPPFGFLGEVANALVIRRQLEDIFAFREKAMEKAFGAAVGA